MQEGRGLFVVVEGLDKAGKSTQVRLLGEALGGAATVLAFPDRSTCIGRTIDDYLRSAENAPDYKTVHLLFAANRWEAQARLERLLQGGAIVLCDRYAFSGAAYTHGVYGEDWEWCLAPDRGLIAPDLVLYLDAGPAPCKTRMLASERKERYEDEHKQRQVYRAFARFTDYYSQPARKCICSGAVPETATKWLTLDATQNVNDVHKAALDALNQLRRTNPTGRHHRLFCK